MVSRIESLAKEFADSGFPTVAEDLRAVAQRHAEQLSENLDDERIFHHSLFDYDPMLCLVRKKDGEVVHLTPTEARLFDVLREKPKRVISKTTLLEKTWGSSHYDEWQVKTYIAYLRRKLEPEPRLPQIIVNVRGAGYYFADDSKVSPEKLEEIFECSGFKFYPERGLITVDEEKIRLATTENKLLIVLAHHMNQFVHKETLNDLVWGEKGMTDGNLKFYIWLLRRKIEPDFRHPKHILTKRFFGYGLFDDPSEEESLVAEKNS